MDKRFMPASLASVPEKVQTPQHSPRAQLQSTTRFPMHGLSID